MIRWLNGLVLGQSKLFFMIKFFSHIFLPNSLPYFFPLTIVASNNACLWYRNQLIFIRIKQKNQKIKIKMADSKKLSFSKSPILKNIFAKISQIGTWVSRIDWYKGHWCGSTYMAVRLSNISSKTALKSAFFVFLGHF